MATSLKKTSCFVIRCKFVCGEDLFNVINESMAPILSAGLIVSQCAQMENQRAEGNTVV